MSDYEMHNCFAFLGLYEEVLSGKTYSPRGLEIREVQNCTFTIDPRYPFTSFTERNLNLRYLAAELIWYLRGDRYDLSICDYGSMWKSLVQRDGGLNSNYGQTIFGVDNQFKWVTDELVSDPDSRRAVFIIGEKDYLRPDVNDQRCCQYIQFMIRDNKLNCYVYFRSNDVSWGVSNDVFTLVEIFKYVYLTVKQYMPNLELGMYTHTATSMHVYEKHYAMLERIINKGSKGFYTVPFCQARKPEEYAVLSGKDPVSTPEKWYSYTNRILEMLNHGR